MKKIVMCLLGLLSMAIYVKPYHFDFNNKTGKKISVTWYLKGCVQRGGKWGECPWGTIDNANPFSSQDYALCPAPCAGTSCDGKCWGHLTLNSGDHPTVKVEGATAGYCLESVGADILSSIKWGGWQEWPYDLEWHGSECTNKGFIIEKSDIHINKKGFLGL